MANMNPLREPYSHLGEYSDLALSWPRFVVFCALFHLNGEGLDGIPPVHRGVRRLLEQLYSFNRPSIN